MINQNSKMYLAGDHNAGLCPEVLREMMRVNEGGADSYLDNEQVKNMQRSFCELTGQNVRTFLFSSGTAANMIGLSCLVKPFELIICAETAHINVHEAGGPVRFSGASLETIPTPDGKITVRQIQEVLRKKPADYIFSQPKVVFITQPTELGVLYSKEEIKDVSDFCKENGLFLFVDGARIPNAAAALGIGLKEMTVDLGVDAFTWGGIKNGGLADVLVIANPSIGEGIEFLYKQIGQDMAKTRIYAATVNALLADDVWIRNAQCANEMAKRLYGGVKNNSQIKIVFPQQTNFVWAVVPDDLDKKLKQQFVYYSEVNNLSLPEFLQYQFFARWMTSWATTSEEVDKFIKAINSF